MFHIHAFIYNKYYAILTIDNRTPGGGLESLNDTRGYVGGSLASGRANLARQALVKRPD
jgi:hypothetical protein